MAISREARARRARWSRRGRPGLRGPPGPAAGPHRDRDRDGWAAVSPLDQGHRVAGRVEDDAIHERLHEQESTPAGAEQVFRLDGAVHVRGIETGTIIVDHESRTVRTVGDQ